LRAFDAKKPGGIGFLAKEVVSAFLLIPACRPELQILGQLEFQLSFSWNFFFSTAIYLRAGSTGPADQGADCRSFAAACKHTEQCPDCSPASHIFGGASVRAEPCSAALTGVYGKQVFATIHRHRAQVRCDIFASFALYRHSLLSG
jgi:hypothetical protein